MGEISVFCKQTAPYKFTNAGVLDPASSNYTTLNRTDINNDNNAIYGLFSHHLKATVLLHSHLLLRERIRCETTARLQCPMSPVVTRLKSVDLMSLIVCKNSTTVVTIYYFV
ncbi:unnamed protein product [Fusarium graminearum]|uniref:Uncharacterized protein n=1 Tax=Gibberella zeae TaxID=5518 RepID=A0A4E9DUV7_GIBZA|nr:unnamed protein product [Fusarium graminearum]CAF3523764.1 unnamed protein product [Fusarium graminearum]CAG1980656.1 unnamed protein product [Fusarium graminearum]CAG1995894.1 unnamed protein product [Fusarium graminearum]